MNAPVVTTPASAFGSSGGWRHGVRYGFMGLPLAFLALPLYVILPNLYATQFGVPLAALGAVLLLARLSDALLDPWIGRWCDQWFEHSHARVLRAAAIGAVAMALGFWAVLQPPSHLQQNNEAALLTWLTLCMVALYAAYSVTSVAHQNWGARLGGDALERSRIVSWREGFTLVGVLLAAALPTWLSVDWMLGSFALLLTLAWWLWRQAPAPEPTQAVGDGGDRRIKTIMNAAPWQATGFRRLLLVYVVNGTAAAIPATLVLFFVQDRIQATASQEPAFLVAYFLAAAASMPVWLALVKRFGIAPTWLAGMCLAVLSFVWAFGLGAGDQTAFLWVCIASGIAAGTDIALPQALLNGLLERLGARGRHEGAYLGWWSLATKLNLALAAGLALPALAWFGYEPGTREPHGLQALSLAYCLLPCALKLVAAALLYRLVMVSPTARKDFS
ncbi:MFS transporter [Hydrogenophaga sp. 5NK40-0174]|uniref:MFS transporter n=1 Tax=Hydrogenophaga sp. 5NK40-0174 TaxID=3127649 RepID=UPI003109AF38